jgi:thymidylate synthase
MAEDILHEPVFTYNNQLFDDMMIPKYHLNAEMIQRSGDAFLGVPFNITSTALLITIIAEICNMVPGNFIHHILSAHIYNNHLDQIKEQLSRNTNIQDTFDCSILWGDDMYVPRDILVDYKTPNNIIKAEMIV